MTPSTTEEIKIQNTVFDLDSMEEVTLVKTVNFTPVDSMEAAAAMLGNDSKKLLAVINDGLREHVRETAKSDPTPWNVIDEEGKVEVFAGVIADSAKVNGLILNMAKSVFGYAKDMVIGDTVKNKAAKKTAKEQAMELIKNTPAIRDGLKNSAK